MNEKLDGLDIPLSKKKKLFLTKSSLPSLYCSLQERAADDRNQDGGGLRPRLGTLVPREEGLVS